MPSFSYPLSSSKFPKRQVLTVHASCVLITLPSTTTGKRTGVKHKVSSLKTASSCQSSTVCCTSLHQSIFLLLRSMCSFRVICRAVAEALGFGALFEFEPYRLRRRGATTHRDACTVNIWMRPRTLVVSENQLSSTSNRALRFTFVNGPL